MNPLVFRTPEHVEVRLRPAGPGSRLIGLFLDWLAITGIATAAAGAVALAIPDRATAAIFLLLQLALSFAWNVGFEVAYGGRTPGKSLVGLRVVSIDGLPVTISRSFTRNALRVLDFLPGLYGLGGGIALADPAGRRLGDLAAGTVVVREDVPRRSKSRLPPEREFNSLETPEMRRRFRHRIGLEERELLESIVRRMPDLSPEARFAVMEAAAELFRERLGVDEPGLSSESFVRGLAALLREPRPV